MIIRGGVRPRDARRAITLARRFSEGKKRPKRSKRAERSADDSSSSRRKQNRYRVKDQHPSVGSLADGKSALQPPLEVKTAKIAETPLPESDPSPRELSPEAKRQYITTGIQGLTPLDFGDGGSYVRSLDRHRCNRWMFCPSGDRYDPVEHQDHRQKLFSLGRFLRSVREARYISEYSVVYEGIDINEEQRQVITDSAFTAESAEIRRQEANALALGADIVNTLRLPMRLIEVTQFIVESELSPRWMDIG